jgi:glycosyltransferase involved in cell wall biosynthesis
MPTVMRDSPQTRDKPDSSWFLMCNSLATGGIERQFNILAKALRGQQHNVRLGCLNPTGAFLEGLGEVTAFPTGGSLLSLECFRNRLRLARFLREHSVLVAHSFDLYSNLVMASVARLAGVPVVIGCQNHIGDALPRVHDWAEVLNFHWCDRVICNSQAALDRLARRGIPRRKLVMISNGIAPEAFVEEAPLLSPTPGLLRIGVIARMNHPVKNQDGFLRAAALVSARCPNTEFVLAGDGPHRQGLQRLAQELGIQDRVRFLGDRRDVPAVLASLDIAVMPSHSESLSNSLLEAMAAGKAVVATDVGGTAEVVHDHETGLLVPKAQVESLAGAVVEFVANSELRRACGARARELALNYTLDKLRDRHIALYETVLAEKLTGDTSELKILKKGGALSQQRQTSDGRTEGTESADTAIYEHKTSSTQ